MSRRRPAIRQPIAEQLSLEAEASSTKKAGTRPDADQAAKLAIARRTKPSAVPGYVKLTITLDLKRELAERLSARAISAATKNLEGVIAELLERGMR